MAKGKCLCGAVTIIAAEVKPELSVCHCGMCRKWAGGPGLVADCGDDVRFEGEESLTAYASSDWGERGFCKVCGTHVFWRLKAGKQYHVPAGIFDEGLGDVALKTEIFIDRKPAFYSFAGDTRKLTEAEVFAMFAPPPEG